MKTVKVNKESIAQILDTLLKRSPNSYGEYEATVNDILNNVRENKDQALFEYTQKFDGCCINSENVKVTKEEIDKALSLVDPSLIEIMKKSAQRIRVFHEKQKRTSFFETDNTGSILGQRITPIEKVGVYVPGGKAAYPSSTLMNVIPAKVAGVERIVMTTPPMKDGSINPVILAAASIAGVDEIYKCGGAQAIAALAFGTESVPKVDKIVGPGNIFVALAKKAVYGFVNIDSIAGPSEIMVLADSTANPRYVAADLLSQAEHDQLASAILVTTDEALGKAVEKEIAGFLEVLDRREIIEKSLDNYGYILIADDMADAYSVVNSIASEHLEVITKDPWESMCHIKNAGAIFLGEYSSEPLGDYFAGPNHVLPTNGTAKFFSPLSVDDFIKKSSVIAFSRDGLELLHEDIENFAKAEGLSAHANSVAVRFE